MLAFRKALVYHPLNIYSCINKLYNSALIYLIKVIICFSRIFAQDSLVSFRDTVINEGPVTEVPIVFKTPIRATNTDCIYTE